MLPLWRNSGHVAKALLALRRALQPWKPVVNLVVLAGPEQPSCSPDTQCGPPAKSLQLYPRWVCRCPTDSCVPWLLHITQPTFLSFASRAARCPLPRVPSHPLAPSSSSSSPGSLQHGTRWLLHEAERQQPWKVRVT